MRVIIIEGGDMCYSSLRFFSIKLKNEFETAGADTMLIDYIPTSESIKDIDLLVGFNLNLRLSQDGENLVFAQLGIPIVDIIVDHPLMHHEQFEITIPNLHIICPDGYGVKFIRRFYPYIKDSRTGYLMGEKSDEADRYIRDREIGVLFSGSYDYEETFISKYVNQWSDNIKNLFYDCVSYMSENPLCPTEEAIITCLNDMGVYLDSEESTYELLCALWSTIDSYMRDRNRRIVIESLVNSGIHVTLYGRGWEQLPFADSQYLGINQPVPMEKSFDLVAHSKINLNIMPLFKNGLHDRVVTTILNGAVLLTDESERICELFNDGEDTVLYSMSDVEYMPYKVHELLADEDYMQYISDAGRKKSEEFSMLEMVEGILKMCF